jgi:NADH-quinone oxidoreductase subunit N
MAGIPPLGGFFSKMFLFSVAVKNNNIGLAIIGILLSTVCAFYYIRLIKIIYFDVNMKNFKPIQTINKSEALIITTTIFSIIFFFLFPEHIILYLHKLTLLYIL